MDESRTEKFLFTIKGEGVEPNSVSVRTLGYILHQLEKVIASSITDVVLNAESHSISLVGVSHGSNSLAVATTPLMHRAAAGITKSIADDDFSLLPPPTRIELHSLWSRSKHHGWEFHIDFMDQLTASIVPDHEICVIDVMKGSTDVLALCQRVGGKKPITAKIIMTNGQSITVKLKNEDQARELGKRLYELVSLRGRAVWETNTWHVIDFEVEEILPFVSKSHSNAFKSLATVLDGFWDDIDPDQFVDNLRSEFVSW